MKIYVYVGPCQTHGTGSQAPLWTPYPTSGGGPGGKRRWHGPLLCSASRVRPLEAYRHRASWNPWPTARPPPLPNGEREHRARRTEPESVRCSTNSPYPGWCGRMPGCRLFFPFKPRPSPSLAPVIPCHACGRGLRLHE